MVIQLGKRFQEPAALSTSKLYIKDTKVQIAKCPQVISAMVHMSSNPFALRTRKIRTFGQWVSASEAAQKAPFSVFVERTRESSSYTGFEDYVGRE